MPSVHIPARCIRGYLDYCIAGMKELLQNKPAPPRTELETKLNELMASEVGTNDGSSLPEPIRPRPRNQSGRRIR